MLQVLKSTPFTVTFNVYNNGTLTNFDSSPTVSAVDAAGNVVSMGGVSNPETGKYRSTVAGQSDTKLIAVTLSGDLSSEPVELVQDFEVVGAFLFSEAAFRAHNGSAMSSESSWSDGDIAAARAAVTTQLEQWTGRSWIPRYTRAMLSGSGDYVLDMFDARHVTSAGMLLRRPGSRRDIRTLLSADDGSVVSPANVVPDGSALRRTDGVWSVATTSDPLNVTVEYEYGVDPHDGVDRIAMLLTADRLRVSAISDRASSFTDETGTLRFATPGRAGDVSNIPEVNEWVKAHDMRLAIA